MRWGLGAVWLRLRWQRKGSQTLFCQEVRKTVFPFSLPSPKDHKITAEKEHCPEFSFLGRLIAFVWGQEPPVKYAGCEVMAHDGDGLQDPPYWLPLLLVSLPHSPVDLLGSHPTETLY